MERAKAIILAGVMMVAAKAEAQYSGSTYIRDIRIVAVSTDPLAISQTPYSGSAEILDARIVGPLLTSFSTSCPAGQTLIPITVSSGIVTDGTCAPATGIDTSQFVTTGTPQGISDTAPKTFFSSITVAQLKVNGSQITSGDISLSSGVHHFLAAAQASSGGGVSTVTFKAGDGAIGNNVNGGDLEFFGGHAQAIGVSVRQGGGFTFNGGYGKSGAGGCVGNNCPRNGEFLVGEFIETTFQVLNSSASFGGINRSTFNVDASSYSLTLSSGINFVTPTTGIQWADGSVTTTAVTGGGGGGAPITNYVTTDTDQLVTGVKTWTSTPTFQANNFSVGTSSFVVLGSSVGIRTASPLFALDVRGPAAFGGTIGSGRFATNGDFSFSGTALYRVATNGAAFVSDAFPLAGFFFDATYGGFTSRSIDGNTYASISLLGADSSYSLGLAVNTGIPTPSANPTKTNAFYVGNSGNSWLTGNTRFGNTVNQSTITSAGQLQLVANSTITAGVLGGSIAMSSSTTGAPYIFLSSNPYNPQVGIATNTFFDAGDIMAIGSGPYTIAITTAGHVETSGPVPQVIGCGTSPSIVGNDYVGTVTVGNPSAGSCTIVFSSAWKNNPKCSFVPSVARAFGRSVVQSSITFSSAFGNNNQFDYICKGIR